MTRVTPSKKMDIMCGESRQIHLEEGNWQETEEAYVEMSGTLMETLQKMDSLKKSEEHCASHTSTINDGYTDIEKLAKTKSTTEKASKIQSKKNSKAMKSSTGKAKLVCAMAVLAITFGAVTATAVSVATNLLFEYVIYDHSSHQPSFAVPTSLNCSARIASKCSLNNSVNNTYSCTTEAVHIEDEFTTTMAIQCIQINDFESNLLIVTSLIFTENPNRARCYCTILTGSTNNSTIFCGVWVNQCSPNI